MVGAVGRAGAAREGRGDRGAARDGGACRDRGFVLGAGGGTGVGRARHAGDHAALRRRRGHVRSGRVHGRRARGTACVHADGVPCGADLARGRAAGRGRCRRLRAVRAVASRRCDLRRRRLGRRAFAGGRGSSHGAGRVCGGAFRVDARDDARRDARLAVLRVDMGSEHGVDAGAAARVAVARAARRRRVRMARLGLARARVGKLGGAR